MRVRVNPIKCQGYGICAELAPDHFVRDDWGLVQARKAEVDPADPSVGKAVEQCPIKAIRWIDDNPARSNPARS
jgi:ferredoxin